ncbi:hypothetical protein RFI_37439, partial [Reticulomyxa filosa]
RSSCKLIEYAMDYVKDKLVDENGIIKSIDGESYEILLQEGANFLLGVSQNNLKEFDEGFYQSPFLITRIFLLFEICIRLKGKRNSIKLPRYEKGMKELQVQLTTLLGLCYH